MNPLVIAPRLDVGYIHRRERVWRGSEEEKMRIVVPLVSIRPISPFLSSIYEDKSFVDRQLTLVVNKYIPNHREENSA